MTKSSVFFKKNMTFFKIILRVLSFLSESWRMAVRKKAKKHGSFFTLLNVECNFQKNVSEICFLLCVLAFVSRFPSPTLQENFQGGIMYNFVKVKNSISNILETRLRIFPARRVLKSDPKFFRMLEAQILMF